MCALLSAGSGTRQNSSKAALRATQGNCGLNLAAVRGQKQSHLGTKSHVAIKQGSGTQAREVLSIEGLGFEALALRRISLCARRGLGPAPPLPPPMSPTPSTCDIYLVHARVPIPLAGAREGGSTTPEPQHSTKAQRSELADCIPDLAATAGRVWRFIVDKHRHLVEGPCLHNGFRGIASAGNCLVYHVLHAEGGPAGGAVNANGAPRSQIWEQTT